MNRRACSVEDLRGVMKRGALYAVLDACDAPAVPVLAEGLGPEKCVSLYRGDAEEIYADIAPYLTKVDSDSVFDWLVQFSATPGWGILCIGAQPLDALRKHLRQFLKVEGPDGKRLYFRFYDPDVLETFLPTCSPEQLTTFYGPLEAYGVLGAEGAAVLERTPGVVSKSSGATKS